MRSPCRRIQAGEHRVRDYRVGKAQDFFKFFDILVYVEATIYSMDEENERLAGAGMVLPDLELHGMPHTSLTSRILLDAFGVFCVGISCGSFIPHPSWQLMAIGWMSLLDDCTVLGSTST